MDFKRQLTIQEENIIFKVIDSFQKYGWTNIKCPICEGKISYIGNNLSFAVSCENCGIIYSLRGI